jgi:light-regulated signal transduction histidine kinase (bacteriophytochrome)
LTSGRGRPRSVAARLANLIAPPAIDCGPAICIEQPVLAERASFWLRILGAGALLALLLGMLAGLATRRAVARRLEPVAATIDRAVHEHDYSQRVPASLGALSTSINTLLEQTQEREVALRRHNTEVEETNKELEAFVYAVSHDLRAPLGAIEGFAQALRGDWYERLDDIGRECLDWIANGCVHMRSLIEGLLHMSRVGREALTEQVVDLSAQARAVADALRLRDPQRNVEFRIGDGLRATGDERLLRALLENLLGNAWKFTRDRDVARIEFGVTRNGGEPAFYVRDNGAGFDAAHASKMFRPFQRLHTSKEFEGTGIGLATVQKIVSRHGGKAWAQGAVGEGATVFFTVGRDHLVSA